jgi:hypothetical protein
MAAPLRDRVLVLLAAGAAVAACTSDDHLPRSDEPGWHGGSRADPSEPEPGSRDAGDETVDGGEADETCDARGGTCLSDPDDPTRPAFCEAIDLVEIEAACPDVDSSCCAPIPAGACEAAGGRCLANPSGAPVDCADLGLDPVGAPCATVDQICCT